MKIFNGWPLVGLISVLVVGSSGFLACREGGTVDDFRLVIRVTARSSLILFLLAFTADALGKVSPGTVSHWLRRNRRYLGVSFAVSHAVHLAAIIAVAAKEPVLFWQLTKVSSVVFGGVAYLLIAAMVFTSFDRTAAWFGAVNWRRLHLSGAWYIWLIFAVSMLKRIDLGPLHWLLAALVLAGAALRILVWLGRIHALEGGAHCPPCAGLRAATSQRVEGNALHPLVKTPIKEIQCSTASTPLRPARKNPEINP